jgi:hypothetical protein
MSDLQKQATPGRPKGCANYPPEFKQRLIAASFKPGVSNRGRPCTKQLDAGIPNAGQEKHTTGHGKYRGT